jgi:integrase
MLTDKQLRTLKATDKVYKVADQQGLYVTVLRTGNISFRYDYRLNGRRETLVIGQYDPGLAAKNPREVSTLEYGMSVSLAEARQLLANARRAIEQGESPSRAKVEKRIEANEGMTFGSWAEKYFAEAKLAESTRAMRKAIYDRNLATEFGRLKLEEITPSRLLARCEKIKERGAPAPAVQSRDIVLQIFRFIQARGLRIENPAEAIRPSAIATFEVRDRALSPEEIHKFFNALEEVSSAATLRLAVKFMLLTMVRKSEFTQAKWDDVNFETGVWTIPKERMKAGRPHNVYLSQQAVDILVAFKTSYGASPYLHPGRYESDFPMSNGTLNRQHVAARSWIQH